MTTTMAPRQPSSSNQQERVQLADVESQPPTRVASSRPQTSRPEGERTATSSNARAELSTASSSSSARPNPQSSAAQPPSSSTYPGQRPSFNLPPQGGRNAAPPEYVYDDEYLEDPDRTIKLGLGDFVFYSLLCAKAALVSFTTFIAVFVVVLFGLAMTLVLLAVYRTALPALPISIILGLIFFFAVDAMVVPFVISFASQIAFS